MRIQFKQAVYICGKSYSVGVHEVPPEVLQHKFFHKLLGAGLVFEPDFSKIVSSETFAEKQRKLAEKLVKKSPMQSHLPKGDVESAGAPSEEISPEAPADEMASAAPEAEAIEAPKKEKKQKQTKR